MMGSGGGNCSFGWLGVGEWRKQGKNVSNGNDNQPMGGGGRNLALLSPNLHDVQPYPRPYPACID
jgi:hypothetical protein